MRQSGPLFWGAILILVGGLLLLQMLGLLRVDVGRLIWPLLLILLGVWTLWGAVGGRRRTRTEQVVIPLEGASEARLRLSFGAGRLRLGVGAGPEEVVSGEFGGGVDYRTRQEGHALAVRLRSPEVNFMWGWGPSFERDWQVRLNGGIPLALDLRTGATDAHLDLTDLRVTELQLKTGASSTDLTLPANAGLTRVDIEAGAAAVVIRVPSSVAARLRLRGGMAAFAVDERRFPRQGDVYQSADYDSAPNKVELEAKAGAGSIDVR